MQWTGAVIFALAVIHTFSVSWFAKRALKPSPHAHLWHLLSEVEAVFAIWAIALLFAMLIILGLQPTLKYVDTRNYTEPLFVVVIMIVAASKPIQLLAEALVTAIARLLPLPEASAVLLTTLALVPLIGSFITEPAAMTVAAILLRDKFYSNQTHNRPSNQPSTRPSNKLKYAVLAVLFVNISIGGSLTAFAAPPVLMVAAKWQWDSMFMATNFGWKAAIACAINSIALILIFRKELVQLSGGAAKNAAEYGRSAGSTAAPDATTFNAATAIRIPIGITLLHVAILTAIVFATHFPEVCIGLLFVFFGLAHAYPQYQSRLLVREAVLVGLFLAGLVILGGLQAWWLSPLLKGLSANSVFVGAIGLTAITDNAALTYLGSLVEGLTPEFKYALVAGAITGGGLTVIANAPNPAGLSILKSQFENEEVSAGQLFLSAALPTLVAALCFKFL